MPSTSKKMARTMAARAHGAKGPVLSKIPVKVAKEFNQADKGSSLLSQAMKKKK